MKRSKGDGDAGTISAFFSEVNLSEFKKVGRTSGSCSAQKSLKGRLLVVVDRPLEREREDITRHRSSSVSIATAIYQSTMSVTARRLARFATALPRTATTPAASCRLLRTASPSISSSARSTAFVSSSRSSLTSRRSYAASAAAVKEAEDGAEAPKWPERVLPEITAKDIQRLSRQRNIGM
jgi:hypothetical protein